MNNLYKYHKFQMGDQVICLQDHFPGKQFTKGNIYIIRSLDTGVILVKQDDKGEPNGWVDNRFMPYSKLALLVTP